MPLHRRRLLLARALTRYSGVPTVPDLLQRSRNTPTQSGLSRTARRRNVRAAFAIRRGNDERVRGKTIVLVEEVLTIGATVEACARVLRSAGASEVHALTLARVERPRLDRASHAFVSRVVKLAISLYLRGILDFVGTNV